MVYLLLVSTSCVLQEKAGLYTELKDQKQAAEASAAEAAGLKSLLEAAVAEAANLKAQLEQAARQAALHIQVCTAMQLC